MFSFSDMNEMACRWCDATFMKHIVFIVFTTLIMSLSVAAGGVDDAGTFLKGKLDAVISVLQTEAIDDREKKERATDIIMPVFDMPLMAKLAVGKKFWPGFSTEQKNRFTHAFSEWLQKSYMGKIIQYTDEKVVYKTPILKKNRAHIPTELISNGSEYSILYKMYRSENRWKIYDVELDRVSILKSFRSQTNHLLNTGTFEDLMRKLEN